MMDIKERFFHDDGILLFVFCFVGIGLMFLIPFGFTNHLEYKTDVKIEKLREDNFILQNKLDSLQTIFNKTILGRKDTVIIQINPQKIELYQK